MKKFLKRVAAALAVVMAVESAYVPIQVHAAGSVTWYESGKEVTSLQDEHIVYDESITEFYVDAESWDISAKEDGSNVTVEIANIVSNSGGAVR